MERVASPRHPAEFLRRNPQLALAEPASAHPVVSEVSRVVTNHPTGLSHPDLSPVLKIRAMGEPDVVVAVAGAVGQGRLLAVGDPSIVMNSMLRYGGNKAFAKGLVRYSVDHDSWGQARRSPLHRRPAASDQKGNFGDEESTWSDWMRALREALEAMRRDGVALGDRVRPRDSRSASRSWSGSARARAACTSPSRRGSSARPPPWHRAAWPVMPR